MALQYGIQNLNDFLQVGHTFGLNHDGRMWPSGNEDEYYYGHGSGSTQWCASMGWGADSLNVFSDGRYIGATNTAQDDLKRITNYSPEIKFRNDDHSDKTTDASDPPTEIVITNTLSKVAGGIIERNDDSAHDVDFFVFTLTNNGEAVLSINEDAVIGASNLDIFATIYKSDGVTVIEDTSDYWDPTNTKISSRFTLDLEAGTYYIKVEGKGWGDPYNNPPSGYKDYGLMGRYSIFAKSTGEGPGTTPAPTNQSTQSPTQSPTTSNPTTCVASLDLGDKCTNSCECNVGSCSKGRGGWQCRS